MKSLLFGLLFLGFSQVSYANCDALSAALGEAPLIDCQLQEAQKTVENCDIVKIERLSILSATPVKFDAEVLKQLNLEIYKIKRVGGVERGFAKSHRYEVIAGQTLCE